MNVLAKHCDDKPITIELKVGEKKGFLCERCNNLFDIDHNGNITKSPLNKVNADVVVNRGNVCTGFGGRLGGFLHKLGLVKDQYKGS